MLNGEIEALVTVVTEIGSAVETSNPSYQTYTAFNRLRGIVRISNQNSIFITIQLSKTGKRLL